MPIQLWWQMALTKSGNVISDHENYLGNLCNDFQSHGFVYFFNFPFP